MIAESTAVWFEDEVYDDANTYIDYHAKDPTCDYFPGGVAPILKQGLTSSYLRKLDFEGEICNQPYEAFAFFDLLSSYCPDFRTNLSLLFNSYWYLLPGGGINAIEDIIQQSNCNFGDLFGVENKGSLLSAFGLYQYATLYAETGFLDNGIAVQGKMSLLDENEPNNRSTKRAAGGAWFIQPGSQRDDGDTPERYIDLDLRNTDLKRIGDEWVLKRVFDIPAYGAISIRNTNLMGRQVPSRIRSGESGAK